jgi:two-component system, OmpR family, phosphate regulon sensor histidine kinase PhoR
MLSAAAISVWLDMAYAARRRERAALAEVERQRRRINALVGAVDVGLQLVDVTGERIFTNTRMQELYELRRPTGLDDSVGHVYAADCSYPLAYDDLPSVRGGRGEEFDGLRIWVGEVPSARRALAVNARNVYDENGDRTGSALAYQDVTELMRALRVKDEFIALVSHELRTPLTSIYGYVSILSEREDLPEQVDRQLAVISRSTDRLKLLVDDLLEATQVAGTGMRVTLAPCLLADIVGEVVVAAKPHAAAARVDLRLVLPDDGDPVPGDLDSTRIAQVVDNLVSNAIKYTPAGGRAEVRLTRHGDHAELVVSDSGIGIREEDLPRVFGRFYRTQEAAEQAIQGLGLGLAITRTIVEAHGGKVEVASRLGEGSTFRVVLPLGEDV